MTTPPPGYPPHAGPYPAQPPYSYPVQPPYNTYAIVAIVLACVVLPPLGIYFGRQAKQEIARTGERGIELANAAVVVGWVLSGLMVAMFLAWCAFAIFFLGLFGIAGDAATSVN